MLTQINRLTSAVQNLLDSLFLPRGTGTSKRPKTSCCWSLALTHFIKDLLDFNEALFDRPKSV